MLWTTLVGEQNQQKRISTKIDLKNIENKTETKRQEM